MATVLAGLGRTVVPLPEASGERYLVDGASVVAEHRPPGSAVSPGQKARRSLWVARYDVAVLAALLLATPGWSLRRRGAVLGCALGTFALLEVVLFLVAALEPRPMPAAPLAWAYAFLDLVGRPFAVLLLYGGLVSFAWEPGAREAEVPGAWEAASRPEGREAGVPGESRRMLLTVMFTDIVGSTERAAELGDRRWRTLLESHNAAVREALARFRGREIDTTGDGFLATFDAPARAIECACAIRDRIRELGIEIRAGLHAGECEVMGSKVGGIVVHLAARVAAAAGTGEVLVSRAVKDLVAGLEIEFEDRGIRSLKGIPGEWRLFAVKQLAAPTAPPDVPQGKAPASPSPDQAARDRLS